MVSVILVTHNAGSDLQQAIFAILEQTCRPMEVVVVDNGCTDGSVPVLDGLAPSWRGVSVVVVRLAKNTGVGGGRNAGARTAAGDVLVWMDDDCRFEDPDAIAGLAEEFRSDPNLAVRAYPIRVRGVHGVRYLVPRSFGRRPRADSSYFLGAGCAMRASVFKELGMFDASLFYQLEELEFAYRLARSRIPVRYRPHPVVVHSPRGDPHERERLFSFYHTRNRIRLARRYLPALVAAFHLWVWLTFLFLHAVFRGTTASFWKGVGVGIRGGKALMGEPNRCRLDRPTLRWMAHRAGRIWY
jgi:GT2 family glycosyltransferase